MSRRNRMIAESEVITAAEMLLEFREKNPADRKWANIKPYLTGVEMAVRRLRQAEWDHADKTFDLSARLTGPDGEWWGP